MANRKHIRLKDSRDAKRLIAKLVNLRQRCEIDSAMCRDIGYLIKIFVDLHKEIDLEERLEYLEKTLQTQRSKLK